MTGQAEQEALKQDQASITDMAVPMRKTFILRSTGI